MQKRQMVEIVVDQEPDVLTSDPEAYPKVDEGAADVMVSGGFYLNAQGEPVDAFGQLLADKDKPSEEQELKKLITSLEQQVQEGNEENTQLQKEIAVLKEAVKRSQDAVKLANDEKLKALEDLKKKTTTAVSDAARQDVKDGEVKPQG